MRLILVLFISFFSLTLKAQITQSNPVKYYEDCLLKSSVPTEPCDYKYEENIRTIVWNDNLIRNYKYSNKVFDSLGYEFVKTNTGDKYQYSKIYRNCSKGVIAELTEWYDVKISVSITWYEPNIRAGIGYLMYCNLNKPINKKGISDKGTLYKSSFYGKGENDPYSNATNEIVKVFIGDSIIIITMGSNSKKYNIQLETELDGSPKIYNGTDDNYLLLLNNVSYVLFLREIREPHKVYYNITLYSNLTSFMGKIEWSIPEASISDF